MNGSQHYREAEKAVDEYSKLLAAASPVEQQTLLSHGAEVYALAQVHATLALAAATIDSTDAPYWFEVL